MWSHARQTGITAMVLHLVLDKDRPISVPAMIAGVCHVYQTLQTHQEQLVIADAQQAAEYPNDAGHKKIA
ncbi:hypothetical protein FC90_GL001023 [Latilactobacillus graminis DSM 20719]|uniref:Uncharacterized protein n=1 Tax=Latilactobacillus graminis DSM 20719 TaxID=1423752 RepID=A0AA89I0Y4_9LACO|nr:hypothetical protein FC90_GL001023 [Latilactobacillus graminis DSM 20719]